MSCGDDKASSWFFCQVGVWGLDRMGTCVDVDGWARVIAWVLAANERRPNWARVYIRRLDINVCIRRTDVRELTSMAGMADDGSGNWAEALFGWRMGALWVTALNESIFGGVNIVTWPSSRAQAQSRIIGCVRGRDSKGLTYVIPSLCSFLYFCWSLTCHWPKRLSCSAFTEWDFA